MNLATTFLQSDFCLRLTETFGHFLWQGMVLALLTAGVAIALRRRSSHLRYGIFLAALLAMVACPLVTFTLFTQSGAPEPAMNLARMPMTQTGALSSLPPISSEPGLKSVQTPVRFNWRSFTPYATAGYLVGVAVMLARLLVGLYGGKKLRRDSEPVDNPAILCALARQAKLLDLTFTPAIAYCHEVLVPTVVGMFRPMVLLPLTLTTGLTIDQIEVILAHELAHIRRYDHLINILQRLIEAFLFFHPAVWYVSRLVRAERELCCDDLVVATGGKATLYASSLLQIAELCLRFKSVSTIPNAAALGLTDRSSSLSHRILRLLGLTSHEQVRLVRVRNVVILILLIIGLALIFSFSTANSRETADISHDNSTTAGSVKISSSSEKNPAQFMIQATILSVPADTDLSFLKDFPKTTPPGSYRINLSQKESKKVLARMDKIKNKQVISSPQLFVREHSNATIQIGQKIPVPVSPAGRPESKKNLFKDVGLIFSLTPELNSQGGYKMILEYSQTQLASTPTVSFIEYSAKLSAELPAGDSLLVQLPTDKPVRLIPDEKTSNFKKEEIKNPKKPKELLFLLLKPTLHPQPNKTAPASSSSGQLTS
jgi:beta-lactamase regulating signal transducer with metallopeptidase domain